MTALPMPGAMSGLTICTRMRSVPAPSIKADSSISFGRSWMKPIGSQIAIGSLARRPKPRKRQSFFTRASFSRPRSLFGGADGEPDLVADGCAINGLKHQFEREALLHLADHDEFG